MELMSRYLVDTLRTKGVPYSENSVLGSRKDLLAVSRELDVGDWLLVAVEGAHELAGESIVEPD